MQTRFNLKTFIPIVALFFILTLLMTFPLVEKFTTCIPGFFSTDESYGVLWDSWRIKNSFQNHLSFTSTDFIAYPFGLKIFSAGYFAGLWLLVHYLLSILSTPVITYNLQVVTNFILSALTVYFLVHRLTKSRYGGIFSGIAFAFCPYQFSRIWQHLTLSYNFLIPLVLLSAIKLKDNPSKKSALLFGLCLVLIFSFDMTIMFLSFISLVIFFFFTTLRALLFKKQGELNKALIFFKKTLLIGLASSIFIIPQYMGVLRNLAANKADQQIASAFNFYRRPFEDLFSQSARPLSYILPSSAHPFFGAITESFIGTGLYGESYTEHTLYLGWVCLFLVFVAFKKRKIFRSVSLRTETDDYRQDDFYFWFFAFLLVVAWLFSQPPWWNIFGFRLYMPSYFTYKFLPMFRAYCRFGIVVMLAVCVLAAFGIKCFLRGRSKIKRIIFFLSLIALLLFEFWNYPPFKIIDVSHFPEPYSWLSRQPEQIIVAEYPLDADSPNEFYKFYQTKHRKRMINCTIPGTYAHKVAQALTDISLQKTVYQLKWMNVKYILVHKTGYLSTGLINDKQEYERIISNPAIKLVKKYPSELVNSGYLNAYESGEIDVYEVITDIMVEPSGDNHEIN